MLSSWGERDPIRNYRAWLGENVAYSELEDEQLRSEVKTLLSDALHRAETSPPPDVATLTDGVYA
jgi:TPP-dependent pyruvate/acetoin dehydrogenase alpha subunit